MQGVAVYCFLTELFEEMSIKRTCCYDLSTMYLVDNLPNIICDGFSPFRTPPTPPPTPDLWLCLKFLD